MPNILDNIPNINKLDSKSMLGSLQMLDKQVEQIWKLANKLSIPKEYKDINNVVVLGMGGSALGTHIMKAVFFADLKVPVELIGGYEVPAYVGKNSLVLASSYSGTTEEVLYSMKEAKKRGAKILAISADGELADWALANKIPSLIFTTENNPSNQPRMGLGYTLVGQIILFAKAGLIKLPEADLKTILAALSKYGQRFEVINPTKNNPAKEFAKELFGRSVWYAASEHLSGNAHVAANQMNENAKRFAGYFLIPELNHHLMEGMLYPDSNKRDICFVLLESSLYHPRVQKRYEVTKKVLQKNKIKYITYKCTAGNKLAEMCEVLVLSSYMSFYSAMLQGIDPTAIPYVDFFKKELGK